MLHKSTNKNTDSVFHKKHGNCHVFSISNSNKLSFTALLLWTRLYWLILVIKAHTLSLFPWQPGVCLAANLGSANMWYVHVRPESIQHEWVVMVTNGEQSRTSEGLGSTLETGSRGTMRRTLMSVSWCICLSGAERCKALICCHPDVCTKPHLGWQWLLWHWRGKEVKH